MSVSVFNKETHANENASQLFSICFQRQILKADHAKRSHAHKEETLSVVVKIPTTIPMASPLPRYSHLAPQYSLVFFFAASFLFFPFSLYLSAPVSWWQFSIQNLTLVFKLSAVPVPATPLPWRGLRGELGEGAVEAF